jgi:Tol biopolymer transport system component
MKTWLFLLLPFFVYGCAGVRQAEVLYLSPIDAPEIWRIGSDGDNQRQLTSTGGKVYDFTPWQDGSRIAFSVNNGMGGTDIWVAKYDGSQKQLLLECGADRCAESAVSPEGNRIAYSRKNSSENPGGDVGLPRLWLINASTGETAPLYRDARISCELPAWSPNGLRISCYDFKVKSVRVHTLASEGSSSDILFPSLVAYAGSWMPDSGSLIYSDIVFAQDSPLAQLHHANVIGESTVLPIDLEAIDYGPPVVSPDGQRVTLGVLLTGGGLGRDLYLAGIEKSDPSPLVSLETNARYSTTACRWSPDGKLLACQQYALGASDSSPSVVLWHIEKKTPTILAENAALPAWIP